MLQPNNNRESTPRLQRQHPRPRNRKKRSSRPPRTMPNRQKEGVLGVLPGVLPEVPPSGQSLTIKRAKEQALEPLQELWSVAQNKGKPTKRPSSRQHRPLRNNNNSRKRKHRPRTNRVSTPSSEHSLLAWTRANTRSSDSLRLSSGKTSARALESLVDAQGFSSGRRLNTLSTIRTSGSFVALVDAHLRV